MMVFTNTAATVCFHFSEKNKYGQRRCIARRISFFMQKKWRNNMTKRITALFLTLVTLLNCIAMPANAASTLEEAMAEVNVYARNDDLDWLRVNGAVKVQHYTFVRFVP